MPKPKPLTQDEFTIEFQAASRSLWAIAVAVLADRSLAEDALQEAAIIGLRKIADFQRGTSFSAWMGQIVRNVARNMGRRRARMPSSGSPDLALEHRLEGRTTRSDRPITGAGELAPEQTSFDDRMIDALTQLSTTARTCLLLRVVADLPYRDIARLLDIPEGTAMSHVHRSRHDLRVRLTADVEG